MVVTLWEQRMHRKAVGRPGRVNKTGILRQPSRGDHEFMNDSDTPDEGQRDERSRSSGTAAKSSPAALSEDPFEHLSPVERFARALERRDALVRKLGEAGKKS